MFKRIFVSIMLQAGLSCVALAQGGEKGPDSSASGALNAIPKTEEAGKNTGAKAPAPDLKVDHKDDTKSPKGKEPGDCVSEDLILVDADALKQFRDSLILRLSGGCAVAFNASAAKVGGSKAPSLYLDSVEMKGVSATPLKSAPGTIDIVFSLMRTPEIDDSRKSWDDLLGKQRLGYPMKLPVALAIAGSPAIVVAGEKRLVFTTVQGGEGVVWGVVVVGVVALVLSFWLLLKGNALRDSWEGPYSLGKSQMAFWGLIVFLSFMGIWIITGTMERIPPQTLALLGISGVTGLAAVLIGNTKDTPADVTAKLNVERAALAAKGATITAQESQRMVKIGQDLLAIAAYTGQTHRTLKDFFRDICDDGTGISVHRVQVLIWTLLLGAVFVRGVTEVISMPEFPQTLLLLLGISNGTYLGFKLPEKV